MVLKPQEQNQFLICLYEFKVEEASKPEDVTKIDWKGEIQYETILSL